jgi:hypothetical protein
MIEATFTGYFANSPAQNSGVLQRLRECLQKSQIATSSPATTCKTRVEKPESKTL